MPQKRVLRSYIAGFAGFVGFLGFRYFFTGDPADLFSFAFLAFFSFFILGKIQSEFQDERWLNNSRKSSMVGFVVAMGFVFVIGFFYSNFDLPKEFVAGGSALGWIASWFSYAISFWVFERE